MARHGKKYLEAAKLVDRERLYPPAEAAALAKETAFVSFDSTLEAHLRSASTRATPTRWSAAPWSSPTDRQGHPRGRVRPG